MKLPFLSRRGPTPTQRIRTLERKIAELEHRIALSEARATASTELFEHRIDQIYGRILPVLTREDGLFAGVETPIAARSLADGDETAGEALHRIELCLRNAGDALAPGRFTPPFSDFGFMVAPGIAVDRPDGLELVRGAAGAAMFGPYKRLGPGRYRAVWTFEAAEAALGEAVNIEADVYAAAPDRILVSRVIEGDLAPSAAVEFDIDTDLAQSPLEFRVHQWREAPVCLVALEIEQIV